MKKDNNKKKIEITRIIPKEVTDKDLINMICENNFSILTDECKNQILKNYIKKNNIKMDIDTLNSCQFINKYDSIELLKQTMKTCQIKINNLSLKIVQSKSNNETIKKDMIQLNDWWNKTANSAIKKAQSNKTTAVDIIGEINVIKTPCENFVSYITKKIKSKPKKNRFGF